MHPMAEVTVYAAPFCLYCIGAKKLLKRRGIPYREVRISMFEDGARDRLQAQIVLDGDPIGGFDRLRALDRSGELSRRTGAAPR